VLWAYIKRKIENEYGLVPLQKHEHQWEMCSANVTNVYNAWGTGNPIEIYTLVVMRCVTCGEFKERKLQGKHSVKALRGESYEGEL
jgi:hypothetical protein